MFVQVRTIGSGGPLFPLPQISVVACFSEFKVVACFSIFEHGSARVTEFSGASGFSRFWPTPPPCESCCLFLKIRTHDCQQGALMGWVMRLGSTVPLQRRSIPAASDCFSWTKEGMCYDSIALLLPIKALSRLCPLPTTTHTHPLLSHVRVCQCEFLSWHEGQSLTFLAWVWVRVYGCWRLVAGQ